MKTITNQQAWAELSSASDSIARTSESLFEFLSRVTEDNTPESALLGDQITEARRQLEDVKRRLRMLSHYYHD